MEKTGIILVPGWIYLKSKIARIKSPSIYEGVAKREEEIVLFFPSESHKKKKNNSGRKP